MQTLLVRTSIVLFAVTALGFVVAVLFFSKEADPEERLRNLASRVEKKPTAINVRRLLVEPSDGAYSYLHMALAGRAFAWHPERFRTVALKLGEGSERAQVENLARFGVGVFEYYPDLQPPEFEKVFARADWLEGFRDEP